jgi:AcrR family transcriptional regulator
MAKIKNSANGTKKETILEEAARLFYEKGFSATSMRDLAEQLGVEAASLYNHIHSKSEILKGICFRVAEAFMTRMEQVEMNNETALKKIEGLIRFHVQQMIHEYEYVHVSDGEWKHLAEPYLTEYQAQRRSYRKRFAALIEEGIRENQVKDIDPPTAVLIMLQAVGGIESWHRRKRKITAEQLEENMVTILVQGLCRNDQIK